MTLEEFLNLDCKPIYKIVHLPRLHLDFKLRALSVNEVEEIMAQSRLNYAKPDPLKPFSLSYPMILASIVEPNLLDERILQKAGVMTPEDFLKEYLVYGEFQEILKAYREVNQLRNLNDTMVEDAKN